MADIYARQHPDERACTSRGCPWVAECEVEGVIYTARSRSGAAYALARILVDAGIRDAALVVSSQGLKGETRYRSFHKMADWTMAESATHPVHRVRWAPYSSPASGQKQGSSDAPGRVAALGG
jgi:hypothetical protein